MDIIGNINLNQQHGLFESFTSLQRPQMQALYLLERAPEALIAAILGVNLS